MNRKLLYLVLAVLLVGLPYPAQASGGGVVKQILTNALGGALFKDQNLSKNGNQSCMSCHHPSAAFADPDNKADPADSPVSDGSDETLFGGRNAPTAAYAGFSPVLHWDGELFIGGMFWDGRASGLVSSDTAGLGAGPTYDPLADQAKGPFLNPVEMAMADETAVVDAVRRSNYAWLFNLVYPGVLNDDSKIDEAYNNIAKAIAAFERSMLVNRFNSKFDKFLKEQGGDISKFGIEEIMDENGEVVFRKYIGPPGGRKFKSKYFSYKEADGLALFNADSEVQLGIGSGENVGAMCYLCHITERHDVTQYGDLSIQRPNPLRADGTYPPIFTDFSYDNLGLPKNPRIADLAGPQGIDFGLGAESRLDELRSAAKTAGHRYPKGQIFKNERGKFKVSSLRNVGATAPYGHNGVFATLEEIVNFYNTRDVANPPFAAPEVSATVNDGELGNLGLSSGQEDKIVAFLKTLSDQ
jgi:cytochrome c peroxidase